MNIYETFRFYESIWQFFYSGPFFDLLWAPTLQYKFLGWQTMSKKQSLSHTREGSNHERLPRLFFVEPREKTKHHQIAEFFFQDLITDYETFWILWFPFDCSNFGYTGSDLWHFESVREDMEMSITTGSMLWRYRPSVKWSNPTATKNTRPVTNLEILRSQMTDPEMHGGPLPVINGVK